jgi:mono/diheme cytochrome c family protein
MSGKLAAAALSVAAVMAIAGGMRTHAQNAPAPTPPPEAAAAPQEQPQAADAAAEPSPCHALMSQPARIASVLNGVERYGSTYVLVVPQRLADTIPDVKAPGIANLRVAAEGGGAAAAAARAVGIANVTEYPDDPSAPFRALQDANDGKVDAAVLWAPLAGLGILELGLDGAVSVYAIDRPHAVPGTYSAVAATDACSMAIREELDVSGVLPAELLVPVEIRPLLTRHVPAASIEEAKQGGPVFNQVCARCHGADAVADPHGLAPVDLRLSIRRFSYPGFTYIVLNGRPQKSMPPLRGTVTEEQIRQIYQYLKARSNKALTSELDNRPPQSQPTTTEKGTNQ